MQTNKSRANTSLNAVDKFNLRSLLYKEIYGLIFERVIYQKDLLRALLEIYERKIMISDKVEILTKRFQEEDGVLSI